MVIFIPVLYDNSTRSQIFENSLYQKLRINLYEDGVYKKTIAPFQNSRYFIAGVDEKFAYWLNTNPEWGIAMRLGHQYAIELVPPEGYSADLFATSPYVYGSKVGNRVCFTYDSKMQAEASGEGAGTGEKYFYRKSGDAMASAKAAKIDLGNSQTVTVVYGSKPVELEPCLVVDGKRYGWFELRNDLQKEFFTYTSSNPSVVSITGPVLIKEERTENSLSQTWKGPEVKFNKPGIATITVSSPASDDYIGIWCTAAKQTITYKVLPKQVTQVKAAANSKKKTIKISWKKDTTVSGYQVEIAQNKAFTKNKKVYTIKNYKTVSKTITKLKKGTCYVRVRAYKTTGKGTLYGKYSKVYSAKIK